MRRSAWETVTHHFRTFKRDDRALAVFVAEGPGGWLAFALETVTDPATPDAVFDDHSHKILGDPKKPHKSERAAKRVASAYGEEWLRSTGAAPSCPCEEIPA